ncbi:hypothetical protein [Solidesulfovibrio sp.]
MTLAERMALAQELAELARDSIEDPDEAAGYPERQTAGPANWRTCLQVGESYRGEPRD